MKPFRREVMRTDEERIIGEMAVGAYRAGADIYLTYFAKEIAKMMDEGKIG